MREIKNGDHISVTGEPYVLIVDDAEPVMLEDADEPGPFIHVRQESFFYVPLAKVNMIFDAKTHIGEPYGR